jgi:hypothetical protein
MKIGVGMKFLFIVGMINVCDAFDEFDLLNGTASFYNPPYVCKCIYIASCFCIFMITISNSFNNIRTVLIKFKSILSFHGPWSIGFPSFN